MSDTTPHTPADVRERVAKIVREAMEDARRSERLNTFPQSSMWDYADRILALIRTPRGEGERVTGAWATVEAAALAQANVLDSHYGGQPAKAAEIRNAVEQVAALLRAPRGEVEAKALAALIVHIWRRCKNEGPHYRETDEFWEDFERAYQLALLRTPRGEGEEDGGEFCDLCGEMFDPSESGTVIGPLGQDDGVPRWYRCPRCARAYDAGYQQGQRDPRGHETADPTARRSDAQGEDQWEDLIFAPIVEAYNEAHAAHPTDRSDDDASM